MKFKSTAAAIALIALGSGSAFAATVGDGDADGLSDVIFQMLNPDTNQTFVWDLSLGASDLTSADFYTNEEGPVGSIPNAFTLQNAELNAFIASAGAASSSLRWRVVGLGLDGVESRNFGALVTSTTEPVSNLPGQNFQVTAFQNLLNNTGNVGVDNDGANGTDDDATVLASGSIAHWDTLGEGLAFSNQARTGFGYIDLWWVHRANTGAINVAGSIHVDQVGSFGLSWDAGLGQASLAYAVPVPAAAWLFGSALVGLAGISRRKTA